MSFEKGESEPQSDNQENFSEQVPLEQTERPYADHPVVVRGEESTIILGEN